MILVVAALTVYRLTVLITWDTITDPLREAIARRWGGRWPDTLVNCAWCASFWISVVMTLALTPVLELHPAVWLMLPFAFSAVTGIIESIRLSS